MSKDAPVMKYVEEYEDTSTVRYQPFSIYKAVMENWQLENLLKIREHGHGMDCTEL